MSDVSRPIAATPLRAKIRGIDATELSAIQRAATSHEFAAQFALPYNIAAQLEKAPRDKQGDPASFLFPAVCRPFAPLSQF
jgi:hypothetical protein